jgi:hypothetical protein
MSPVEITGIDVNSLDEGSIDQLLSSLQEQLIQAQKVPVSVAARTSFDEEWSNVQDELIELFEANLTQDKNILNLECLMRAIIGEHFDEDATKGFFDTFTLCEQEQNFRKSTHFINSQSSSIAASLCFYVYRLNKSLLLGKHGTFYGKRHKLLYVIKPAVNSDCPVTQALIKEFTTIIPSYSTEPLLTL